MTNSTDICNNNITFKPSGVFQTASLPEHSECCVLVKRLPFTNTVNIVYETDEQCENFSCCLLDFEEENILSSEDERDIEVISA